MQKYLGIRAEFVDLTEILRRMKLGIYDKDEYEKALNGLRQTAPKVLTKTQAKDLPEIIRKSKVISPDKDWEFITKFTIIVKDILYGNPKLDEMGWHEEALGKNAIVGGFRDRELDRLAPPTRISPSQFMATSFDWNGKKQPTAFRYRK